jgi:hypothetical protein
MPGPDDPSPDDRSTRIRGAIRWLVTGAIGVLTTLSIFAAMAFSLDATDLVGRLFRLFPLTQTELATTDECRTDASHLPAPVLIEGVVGHLSGGAFRPLGDAAALGDDSVTRAVAVEISAGGAFRFATTFPSDAPSPCGPGRPTGGESQVLTFQAPGCIERRVPVTRAWVPHSIVLACPERRGSSSDPDRPM